MIDHCSVTCYAYVWIPLHIKEITLSAFTLRWLYTYVCHSDWLLTSATVPIDILVLKEYSIWPSNTTRVQNLLLIKEPSLLGKELSQSCKLNALLMPIFFQTSTVQNLLQSPSCQAPQSFAHSPYWNLKIFSYHMLVPLLTHACFVSYNKNAKQISPICMMFLFTKIVFQRIGPCMYIKSILFVKRWAIKM